MAEIISNILEFEASSPMNFLEIVEYTTEKLNYHELGIVLRRIRKTNEELPIIQFGNSLISVSELLDDIYDSLKSNFSLSRKTISINHTEGREIIRRLIGEMIAVQLRRLVDGLWKVEETQNCIFEVSNVKEISHFGPIDVYPGFRYSPIVLSDGKIGVIIDPKYKFHSSYTLRDRLLRGELSLNNFQHPQRYIDICPLSYKECPEKNDSQSSCKLAGTGKTVYIKSLIEKKPSEILIKENENLIEYHKREELCPRTPALAKRILNDTPVAIAAFSEDNSSEYFYPLERLREIPSFDILDKDDRTALMSQIRPIVEERHSRTRYYMSKIRDFALGSVILKPSKQQKIWIQYSDSNFTPPNLVVGSNHRTKFPSFDLQEKGIFDPVNSVNLYLQFIYFHEKTERHIETIKDVFVNENKSTTITSFVNYSKIKTNIIDFKNFSEIDDLKNFLSKLKKHKYICIILIHSSEDNINPLSKFEIEKRIIEFGFPKQGINLDEFIQAIEKNQLSYLKNIYLGIIAKIGLMAWLIDVPEDKNVIYIGLSSKHISDRDYYKAGLCAYQNTGRFIVGRFISCKKEDRIHEFTEFFSHLIKNEEHIFIMKHGLIRDKEYTDIEEALSQINKKAIFLELISSPLRLYKVIKRRIQSPPSGTYMPLSDTEIGIVTTRTSQGTTDPIVLRTKNVKITHIKEYIQSIFNLTQCYTGWEKYITKFPLPIHASDRVLRSGRILELSSFDFDKAWFV